jgi:transcriptional regulator with XRE-family HTH domain
MRETLARNLRLLRADRDLSLTDIEESIGVVRETITALEHAERGAYTSTLEKLADFYGVTVPELLSEELFSSTGKAIAPAA